MSIISNLEENENFQPWVELPEKIARRRLLVRSLVRKGFTKSKISSITKVSKMTIHRDIKWFTDNNLNLISNFDSQIRIAESLSLYKEIEEFAMKSLYEVDDDDKAKSQFIKNALEARKAGDQLLLSIGALHLDEKPTSKIDISKMNEEDLDNFLITSAKEIEALEEEIKRIENTEGLTEKEVGWGKRLIGG